MTDAFEKSAQRLLSASPEDRAWVLAKLDPEDRIRVLAMLRDRMDASNAAPPADVPETKPDAVSPPSGTPLAALMTVSGEAMITYLKDEPDWIIAILVSDARWPWVEGVLAALPPERLDSVERWVRQGQGVLRGGVIERVAGLIAARLENPGQVAVAPSTFETILARLKERPADVSNDPVSAQP